MRDICSSPSRAAALAPSAHSAFSIYAKKPPPVTSTRRGQLDPSLPRRPIARRPAPTRRHIAPPTDAVNGRRANRAQTHSLILDQRSASNLHAEISRLQELHAARPRRSNSADNHLDVIESVESSRVASPTHEEFLADEVIGGGEEGEEEEEELTEQRRAKNFKQILTRFQSASARADAAAAASRPIRRLTIDTVRVASPALSASGTSSAAVSRRSSLHSSSAVGRQGSSPHSPFSRSNSTRSSSARSAANNRMLASPMSHYIPEAAARVSSSATASGGSPPLSHTGSTPPIAAERAPPQPRHRRHLPYRQNNISTAMVQRPLTIAIPPSRLPFPLPEPAAWVKETDIDDPASFTESSQSRAELQTTKAPFAPLHPMQPSPSLADSHQRRRPYERNIPVIRSHASPAPLARVSSGSSSLTLLRRPHSRENLLAEQHEDSIPPLAENPFMIFGSDQQDHPEPRHRRSSLLHQLPNSQHHPSASPSARLSTPSSLLSSATLTTSHGTRSPLTASPALSASRSRAVEARYKEMTSSTATTLAWVAEQLQRRNGGDRALRCHRNQPVVRFSQIRFTSRQPTIARERTLFFDAILPASDPVYGNDVEVTIMMAPHGHYAPLLRRALAEQTAARLADDDGGNVVRFLHDSGIVAETGSGGSTPPRTLVLTRLQLFSIHALAAQQLQRTLPSEAFEAHVCFILIRILAALKLLQTDGIESLSVNFREFLLAYRNGAPRAHSAPEQPRLIFLPESLSSDDEGSAGSGASSGYASGISGSSAPEQIGLCRYALRSLCTLMHQRMDGRVPPLREQSRHSRALLAAARCLAADKSSSLSSAKQLLELSLWASDMENSVSDEFEARLWLDAKRSECSNQLLKCVMESEVLAESLLSPACPDHSFSRHSLDFLLSATPRSLLHARRVLSATQFD